MGNATWQVSGGAKGLESKGIIVNVVSMEKQEAYDRALAAEPALVNVVRVVGALRHIDIDSHESLDLWGIVKQLITPWIGYGRGQVPTEASDEIGNSPRLRAYTFNELLELPDPERVPATTETEKWMRTEEAYDAFKDVILSKLRY